MISTNYVEDIKATLLVAPIVASFVMVEEWIQSDRGYLRVRCTLINSDFLEMAEYFVLAGAQCIPERYRHQWMDATQTLLRRRWDNVPHFPTLPNFPHHIHLADGQVVPGVPMSITSVLTIIAGELAAQT